MERLLIGVASPGAMLNELEEVGRRLDAGEHLPEVQHSELNAASAVPRSPEHLNKYAIFCIIGR
jgi:hypothetical protein